MDLVSVSNDPDMLDRTFRTIVPAIEDLEPESCPGTYVLGRDDIS